MGVITGRIIREYDYGINQNYGKILEGDWSLAGLIWLLTIKLRLSNWAVWVGFFSHSSKRKLASEPFFLEKGDKWLVFFLDCCSRLLTSNGMFAPSCNL